MFLKWLKKWRIKKICKANRYFCPDCIYHEHIFEGAVFRGTRCRLENKPLTCDGCEHLGEYENEAEYGYPSPCTACQRRAVDNYRSKPKEAQHDN